MDYLKVLVEAAETLTVACLNQLVRMGRITPEDVNSKWHVKVSDQRLKRASMYAAATIDPNNRAVIYIRSDTPPDVLPTVISHEAVHLMQICRGDLIPEWGSMIWKGTAFPSLPAGHPEYCTAQPWEAEATELQPILLAHIQRLTQ